MEKNLHDIDRLFKEALEGETSDPPGGTWEAVARDLDTTGLRRSVRRYHYLLRFTVVTVAGLLAVLGYHILTDHHDKAGISVLSNRVSPVGGISTPSSPVAQPALPAVPGSPSPRGDRSAAPGSRKPGTVPGSPAWGAANPHPGAGQPAMVTRKEAGSDSAAYLPLPSRPANANEQAIFSRSTPQNTTAAAAGPAAGYAGTRHLKPATRFSSVHLPGTVMPGAETPAAGRSSNPFVHAENGLPGNITRPILPERVITPGAALPASVPRPAVVDHSLLVNRAKPGQVSTGWNFSGQPAPLITPGPRQQAIVIKHPAAARFSVFAYFSPQFSVNHIEAEDDHVGSPRRGQPDRDDIQKHQESNNAYSAGSGVEWHLAKRWSVQAGLEYLHQSVTQSPQQLYALQEYNGQVRYRVNCASGYGLLPPSNAGAARAGDSIRAGASRSTLAYIGVPVMVNRYINKGRFSLVPSAGMVFNILVDGRIATDLPATAAGNKVTTAALSGLSKSYFAAMGGLSLQYNAGKNLSLFVTPAGSVALGNVNNQSGVKSYPAAFRLAAGFKIKL